MQLQRKKFCSGLTLVELTITMGISAILVLVVGVLLVSGQRAWNRTFDSAQKQIKHEAQAVMIAFGSMGRKTNRLDYTIYEVAGGTFTPAVRQTSGREVVSGDAVEFRYWDVPLNAGDTYDLLNVTKTATAYALFYLDGSQLKVDYYSNFDGQQPPPAVPSGGGARNTSNITTTILANDVTTDAGIGAFSHTVDADDKSEGSVRINITLTDPDDNKSIKVMTATLLRNIWPR